MLSVCIVSHTDAPHLGVLYRHYARRHFPLIKGLGYSLTISGTLPGGEHTSRTESSLFTQIFVSLPLRDQSRFYGRARKSAVIAIIGVAILLPPCSYLSLARFRGLGVWMSAARGLYPHRSCCTLVCCYSFFKFLKGFFICPSTHKELREVVLQPFSKNFFIFFSAVLIDFDIAQWLTPYFSPIWAYVQSLK